MKSFGAKLIMTTGLLMTVLTAFCPPALARTIRGLTPPAPHFAQPVPPPGVKYLKRVENLVFAMTNQLRRIRGVAPLIRDAELRKVARAFSDDMLVRQFFGHTTPDGVPFYRRIRSHYPHRVRAVGENIWESFGYAQNRPQTLAKLIMADWMSSPGHRANLLDPDYTHLGIGVSARQHQIKATQEFVGRFKAFNLGKSLASDSMASVCGYSPLCIDRGPKTSSFKNWGEIKWNLSKFS
jgi:uncharacterized protein YkwD